MYKSYGLLRPVVIFAGTIGILQSLVWIAMSVLGIIAYYCVLNFRGMPATLGTITELVLFHLYFHGTCAQPGLPNVDFSPLDRMNLVRPLPVHICMWIYLGISFLWLLSSITLLTSVRYVNLRNANYFLYMWIILTIGLSILDLGLGIVFSLDYDTLRHQAHGISVDDTTNEDHPQYLIMSAKAAAGIMMGVSFRGFTIWLINVILCIYFFTQTFKISDYNRIKEAISNPAFGSASNTLQRNQALNAFGPKDDQWVQTFHSYGTQSYPMERSPVDMKHSNQAAALFEERKRHYEAQQMNYLRYMDNNKRSGRKSRTNSGVIANGHLATTTPYTNKKVREISVPVPDYSPDVHRADSFETRPPLRSALRASRY